MHTIVVDVLEPFERCYQLELTCLLFAMRQLVFAFVRATLAMISILATQKAHFLF
jgi:hypothetical protein